MLRSELIKELAKLYASFPENASNYHICDILIGKAERLGMLPPKKWRDKNWNELGITYSAWIQLESEVNEWDKEDEEK